MIMVAAEVETTLEALEAMKDAIRAMEEATRAESGCHEYVLSQEVSAPAKLRLFELWESMAALEAHFATAHMAAFNQALGANPPKSMSLKVFELGSEVSLPGATG